VQVRVATFKYGIPAGYCYVYFATSKTAQVAFETLNGRLMEGTNHVFRLKIANKNSRFFSRSHSKDQPPHPHSHPQQQQQQQHFPPPPQQQTQQQFRPAQFAPKFERSSAPSGLASAMVPPQVVSQAPSSILSVPSAAAMPPHNAAQRDFLPEQDSRLSFHATPEEQAFIDETFDDLSQAFDPGMGEDFAGRSPRVPSFSVFVGNLGQEVDRDALLAVFQTRYASVVGGKIVFDPFTGVSKGYGFVIFEDENDQHRALKEMQGQLCGDRPMRINKAVRRT